MKLFRGAIGSAHVLAALLRNTRAVKKVICLHRSTPPAAGDKTSPQDRQRAAFRRAGAPPPSARDWAKVEFLPWDPSRWDERRPDATDTTTFAHPAAEVTHVIHLAWPMDFHRTLARYGSQLRALRGLAALARAAHAACPTLRVRLLFASSIAVVRDHHDGGAVVPEAEVVDPNATVAMGYAEAKWACESWLGRLAKEERGVETVVVRIGQLSGPGPTTHAGGAWKASEHIPALVAACQRVGAFPAWDGRVSWLPVDRAARALVEMLFHPGEPGEFLNLENPVRQPIKDIFTFMAPLLGLVGAPVIPYEGWLDRVFSRAPEESASLGGFFQAHFRSLAGGDVVLDTTKARAISGTLRGSSAIGKDLVQEYVRRWQRDGFIQ